MITDYTQILKALKIATDFKKIVNNFSKFMCYITQKNSLI